ncbi:unnamed protein product [Rotaria sp. Silwood1]|nr:unnamed protein product [Rotaria sp. Silwood1]CAF4726873.1 unnamed protein product [Rotaria sp. Silwood1]CAF4788018.1 unnamed protein product [Rotaria sp. Silwood1]
MSSHSAWESSSSCSLFLYNDDTNSNNNSCRSSMTLCFNYHTNNNISYCAPASRCSILEPCDNVTGTCVSDTSVCIIDSCCVPKIVCLPLSWTLLCSLTKLGSFLRHYFHNIYLHESASDNPNQEDVYLRDTSYLLFGNTTATKFWGVILWIQYILPDYRLFGNNSVNDEFMEFRFVLN